MTEKAASLVKSSHSLVQKFLIVFLGICILFIIVMSIRMFFPGFMQSKPDREPESIVINLTCKVQGKATPCDDLGLSKDAQDVMIDELKKMRAEDGNRLDILEARLAEVGNVAQIVGVSTGLFGVLLTVLVLYFSLNQREEIEEDVKAFIYATKEQAKALGDQAAELLEQKMHLLLRSVLPKIEERMAERFQKGSSAGSIDHTVELKSQEDMQSVLDQQIQVVKGLDPEELKKLLKKKPDSKT